MPLLNNTEQLSTGLECCSNKLEMQREQTRNMVDTVHCKLSRVMQLDTTYLVLCSHKGSSTQQQLNKIGPSSFRSKHQRCPGTLWKVKAQEVGRFATMQLCFVADQVRCLVIMSCIACKPTIHETCMHKATDGTGNIELCSTFSMMTSMISCVSQPVQPSLASPSHPWKSLAAELQSMPTAPQNYTDRPSETM